MTEESQHVFSTPFERNRRALSDILKSRGLNGYGVEIGVKRGDFSKHLLSTTDLKKLYLVDPWMSQDTGTYDETHHDHDDDFVACMNNVQPFQGRYEVVKELSHNAYSRFADEFFDFIYIDGNHSYAAVAEDLRTWYPKLKTGGVIAGDDYTRSPVETTFNYTFGVKRAVDEFVIQHKKNVSLDLNGDWYYSTTFNNAPLLFSSRNWYFVK